MSTKSVSSSLTAEQRRHAIAAILARGVLRYHRRIRRLDSGPGENFPDFSPGGLEVLGEPLLLPHWHANQLRHSKATEVRREFGLEAAQVVLFQRIWHRMWFTLSNGFLVG